jgi:hypothetical protein
MVRALLSEAANVLLTRVSRWSWLKRWGVEVMKRRGKLRAQVAVARRLAVIMHRMWTDGTEFRSSRDGDVAAGVETKGEKHQGIRCGGCVRQDVGPDDIDQPSAPAPATARSARTFRD